MDSLHWTWAVKTRICMAIFLVLFSCVFCLAGDPVVPRNRVTEIDKVPQHLKVQEEIYEYINRLLAYQDSNFTLFGEDAVGADSSATIYLSQKYSDSAMFVVTATVKSDTAHSISAQVLSDSSFWVKADSAGLSFYWIAVGVKGD